MKKEISYFSKLELGLWGVSALLILVSFFVFEKSNYLTLVASLVGATSLIFNAKGNPFGQILMILFSLLYGVISFQYAYYGEMITYLGMTAPMALVALVSWLRHPYKNNKTEVAVNSLKPKESVLIFVLSVVVTVGFYYILVFFNTANIIPSTISVTTSFVAAYLTFRRSPYFAIAYALNDVVLILLWAMASVDDVSYISVVICFVIFLVNDIYGFISWMNMKKRQQN